MEFLIHSEKIVTDPVFQFLGSLGKAFSTIITNQSNGNTTEVPVFWIENPIGSDRVMRMHWIQFWVTDLTANQEAILNIYRNPTVTSNGSTMTITSSRPSKKVASIALSYKAPTVSANGSQLMQFIATSDTSVNELDHVGIFLDDGESLLFTVTQSANGIDYALNLSWSEITETENL